MMGMDGTARPTKRAAARALTVLGLLGALAVLLGPGLSRGQQPKEMIADVVILGARAVPVEKAMRYVHTRKNIVSTGRT